ncbi:MAG: hypothetical protein C4534_06450 [Gaiellales bacterium]|nr:MAG: hypothetical protein C4534_06450 [Gaiellales bacterium]
MRISGQRIQEPAAGTSRRFLFNLSVAAALGLALVLLLFVIGFSARAGSTAPVISAIAPTGTINTHNAAVTAYIGDGGGGVDSASIAVYVDGAAIDGCVITGGNASCNVYGLDNGAHDVVVYASDNHGNVGSGSGSFNVLAPYDIKDDGAGGDCPLIGD